jgi:hypothetical protein
MNELILSINSHAAARTLLTNAPVVKNPRNPVNPDSNPGYRIRPGYPKD